MRKKILGSELFSEIKLLNFKDDKLDTIRQSQYIDLNYTLPLSLLNKLDRCSMLNSVESRSPFLNKDIVEFSTNKLDSFDLATDKQQKKFLKKFGQKYLPKNFIFDRKQGFSFPLIDIIQNPNQMKKVEQILMSKSSLFEKQFIIKFLKMIIDSKIRPELLFCLLSIQLWINKNNIKL